MSADEIRYGEHVWKRVGECTCDTPEAEAKMGGVVAHALDCAARSPAQRHGRTVIDTTPCPHPGCHHPHGVGGCSSWECHPRSTTPDPGPIGHKRIPCSVGVKCRCGFDAQHKVGEETGPTHVHNLTTYICCTCFIELMGPAHSNIPYDEGSA